MRNSAITTLGLVAILLLPCPGMRTALVHASGDPSPATPEAGNPPPSLYRHDLEMPDTLGIGRVARDVARHLPALEAMSAWLAGEVTSLGFARVRPVVVRDNREMIDFLRRGIVDLVSETPLSAIQMAEESKGAILVRERRKGHATYSSMLFVREDSPIHSLADLVGRRIAFEDRGSTTAFLLPLAAIKRAGIAAVALDDASAPVPKDAAGYYFALSDSSIRAAVERGAADAGATSDEDWRSFRIAEPGRSASLRLIYESPRVPRAFVVAGPSMSVDQREGVRSILLGMDSEGPGRAALEAYNHVDHFDPIDADLERQIAELHADYDLVREDMR